MAPSARASPTPSRSLHASSVVDSPVFRFHHLDDHVRPTNPSYAVVSSPQVWTRDEHELFLLALEKYGCGTSTSVYAAWHAIASAVATRSVAEVQAHATQYYTQLQRVNAQRRKEYLTMQQIDMRWTMDEDALLENELATQSPHRVSYPWGSIARRVPGKTPRDARERYHKLCYDISRIESGQPVMMQLSRYPKRPPTGKVREDTDANGIDSVVTLTAHETELLFRALEQVSVPCNASPDILAAVASGVAALACTKHKQPPRRQVPRFTVDIARGILEQAIHLEIRDPSDTLELLANELHLRPEPTLVTRRSYPPDSVSFVDRSSRSHREYDDTPAGEDLLTHLRSSPVHDPRRVRESRRLQRTDEYTTAFPVPNRGTTSFPYSLMPSTTASYSEDRNPCDRRYSNQDDFMNDYF